MRRVVVVLVACGCTCLEQRREAEEAAKAAAMEQLAPKGRAGAEQLAAVVRVHLEANGDVVMNDAPLKVEALSARLRAMREKSPSVEVHVDAAEQVPYPKVIEVLDAVRNAGIVDVSLEAPPDAADAGGVRKP